MAEAAGNGGGLEAAAALGTPKVTSETPLERAR